MHCCSRAKKRGEQPPEVGDLGPPLREVQLLRELAALEPQLTDLLLG